MKIIWIVLSLTLALSLVNPPVVYAGGCCTIEQCSDPNFSLSCYPADSPESAICQIDNGTVACTGEAIDEVTSCVGEEGSIPLNECKEIISENQNTQPAVENETFSRPVQSFVEWLNNFWKELWR